MPRREDDIGIVEGTARAGLGLGLGYAALRAYHASYSSLKRNFLGLDLSPTVKRAFTKIWQFSNEFFENIEFQKSLSLPSYMQRIPSVYQIDGVIDEVTRKKSQIDEMLGRMERTIEDIEGAAKNEGVPQEFVDPLLSEFADFRNRYFERAMTGAEAITEESFHGRSAAIERGRLEALRMDQLESINQQLKIFRDRTRTMESQIHGVKNDIYGIRNRTSTKLIGVSDEKTADIVAKKIENIKGQLLAAKTNIQELGNVKIEYAPPSPRPDPKFWTITADVTDLRREITNRRLIGRGGLHSIAQVVKNMYDDPILDKDTIGPDRIAMRKLEERSVRREFMSYVRDSIRDLQRTGQFTSIELGTITDFQDSVIIRAIRKDGKELTIPIAKRIPRLQYGVPYSRKGGKVFFQPFTRQRNTLLMQAQQASYMLSDPAHFENDIGERINDSLDTMFNHLMLPSKTALADWVQSQQINQKLTHEESKIYTGAWDSFRKIQQLKMARGSILHIDLEGDQIGWVLMDWKGRPIDGYHFAIGTAAASKTPTHLRSKRLNNHMIVQEIGENDLDRVVDALSDTFQKSYGRPMRVASKAYGLFDKEKLDFILSSVDRRMKGGHPAISALKTSLASDMVIELNNIPRLNGEVLQVKGSQLFRIMSRHLKKRPKMKMALEQLAQKVGIPSFDDIGQMVAESGMHVGFLDAFVQGLYVEFTKLLQKKDPRAIEREFKKIKQGFLPDRLTIGYPFNIAEEIRRLNVSASASIHGKVDGSRSMLTNPFPDARPGLEYRMVPSMQLRTINEKRTKQRIQLEIKRLIDAGVEPDIGQILLRELNQLNTDTLVLLDPGGTREMSKDDFGLSDPLAQNGRITEPVPHVVDKGTAFSLGIKEGSEVHAGSIIGMSGSQCVEFRARTSAQKGVVTSVIDNLDGTETVVINRMSKIGWGIPVIVGGSQAATTTKVLSDYLPHIGGSFSSFRLAAYAEKNNPGAMMSDMLALMFHHAGMGPNAATKNSLLTDIVNRAMGMDPKDARRAKFPMKRNGTTGMLIPDVRNREHWYEFFKDLEIGKIVEISEEYKNAVATMGDPFTGNRLLFDELQRNIEKPEFREIQDSIWRTYGMFMGQRGYIEANVKIAFQNLKRPTSGSAITARAGQVRDILNKGDIKSAMALMREDIPISEVDDILHQGPAHFGFARKFTGGRLTWAPATVSWDSVAVRDFDTMSGLGDLKTLNISLSTMDQLSPLRDSKGLVDMLRDGIMRNNPITSYRLWPYAFLSSPEKLTGFRAISRDKSARFLNKVLGNWMNLPETIKAGNFNGWVPTDAVYDINGNWMTKDASMEHYGMSSLDFDDAVRSGKARLVDPTVLRSRLRAPEDIAQMVNRNMQPFTVEFGRDARISVGAQWSKANVNIERLLVTQAAKEDYFPIQLVGPNQRKKTYYVESPIMMKTREVLRMMLSGGFMNPRDGNTGGIALQGLFDLYQNSVVKLNMKTNQMTTMVPVVRFHGSMLFTDFPQLSGGVTTKEEAMRVLRGVFSTGEIDSKMFLSRRGLMPRREGIITGVDERAVDSWIRNVFGTLSSDDIKATANRFLGNVKLGNKSGVNPALYMLKVMAGHIKVDGGPLGVSAEGKTMATNAMGLLHSIVNSKNVSKTAREGFLEMVLKGVFPMSMGGLKFPLADQGKFVGEDFYKAMAYGEDREKIMSRLAIGGSPVGVMPSAAMFQGTIDTDGDFLAFMLGEGTTEKILKIMKANTFFSEINPIAQVVGTEGGMVQLYDTANNEFIKRPMGVTSHLAGLNKMETMRSEMWTKQAAGKITIFSENIGHYMSNLLSQKGGSLATDLGQDTLSKMRLQLRECMGALIEGGALKGKASNTAGADSLIDFFDRLGTESGVREFMGDVEKIVSEAPPDDFKAGMFKKLLHPIIGMRGIFEGTNNMDFGDIMIQAAKGGRALGGLTPDEILIGTAFRAKDTYKRGMVEAMRSILPEIATEFTPWKQEGVLTAMGRNVTNEFSERQWRNVSKGMGWAAAAGAVFLATNIFRPDDNQFLGDRPGFGGEARDYTWTRPEYEMAGLLDTPYKNPWAKQRAYVSMASPTMQQKMASLSEREQEDLRIFHETMGLEKVNTTSSFDHRRQELAGYRNLLSRYGHT
jgi:hypothetical protein